MTDLQHKQAGLRCEFHRGSLGASAGAKRVVKHGRKQHADNGDNEKGAVDLCGSHTKALLGEATASSKEAYTEHEN
jgi:hypothetical protein